MVEQRAYREVAGGALMTASHQRLAATTAVRPRDTRVDKLWERVLQYFSQRS
jgi:hypothetical protein